MVPLAGRRAADPARPDPRLLRLPLERAAFLACLGERALGVTVPHLDPAHGAGVDGDGEARAQRVERQQVCGRQVGDVHVVAEAGAVGRVVVGAEDLHPLALAERGLRRVEHRCAEGHRCRVAARERETWMAIGLSAVNGAGSGACLVIFETLAGRG